MKFIITPTHTLFLNYLRENNLPRNDREIIHISSYMYLLGRTIKNQDEVIYYSADLFRPEHLQEIKLQVKMRQVHN